MQAQALSIAETNQGEERKRFFPSTRPVVFWFMNTHGYIYITEPASNVIMHECVESV